MQNFQTRVVIKMNIDINKKIEENNIRIEEIKESIPNLKRSLRVLQSELKKLENINLFLEELEE